MKKKKNKKSKHKLSHFGIFMITFLLTAFTLMVVVGFSVLKLGKDGFVQIKKATCVTCGDAKKTKEQKVLRIVNFEDQKFVFKSNIKDSEDTDVFIIGDGEKEEFIATVDEMYVGHYHNLEYYNGNLYVLKRLGQDGYSERNWDDQLWVYDSNGKGKKLYPSKGVIKDLDFRVSPGENFFAVEHENSLHILDMQGKILGSFEEGELGTGASAMMLKWSEKEDVLWGVSFLPPGSPKTFFEIEAKTQTLKKYDVSDLAFGRDYDINMDERKLAFSLFPPFVDEDSFEEYQNEKTENSLFVYDLNSKKKEKIVTSVAKEFKPEWISENEIEYSDPNIDKRVIKRLSK